MKLILRPLICSVTLTALAGLTAPAPTNAPPASPVPTFSPDGGVFGGRVEVKLSAPEGVVRYTLDGNDPTEGSPVASGSLRFAHTTLLQAAVFRQGRKGPVVTRTFVVTDTPTKEFASHLPVLILNTFGQTIERENKVGVSVRLVEPTGRTATLATAPVRFDGRGQINLRGHSSLRYVKRSYSLKTAEDVSLLGLPKDSDWVLYAPYPDKSLLRDVVAYELFRQMGRYASRTRFVEVFANENVGRLTRAHYLGLFVLEEKIKRSPDRINLQKLGTNDNAEPNITGGYIFKKDHFDRPDHVTPTEDGWPNMQGNSSSRFGYPTGPGGFPADPRGFQSGRTAPVNRTRRLNGRLQEVQPGFNVELDRLAELPPAVPPPRGPDVQFEDRGRRGPLAPIFEELVRQQIQVRRGGPMIRYGSMGDEMFVTRHSSQFFYVEPKPESITPAQKEWLQTHLNRFEEVLYGSDFADPKGGYAAWIDVDSFIDQHLIVEVTKNIDGFRFSTYYQKDRGGKIRMEPIWDWNLSFGNANGKQGWLTNTWYWPQLDDQQYTWFRRLFEDPNFGQRYVDRWGQLKESVFSVSNIHARIDARVAELGPAVARNFERWPILGKRVWPNYYVGQTYEDEVRFMKQWIANRLDWIDRQIVAAPRVSRTRGAVSFTAREGQVYYTLDGTDPRAAGGTVSAGAKSAESTVTLPAGAKLVARAFYENRWSPTVRL